MMMMVMMLMLLIQVRIVSLVLFLVRPHGWLLLMGGLQIEA